MRFARPPRRPRPESVVPMINVVFLLLIFFLMTAEIAAPPPFELALPEAEAPDRTEDAAVLALAEGEAAFAGARGAAAWAALAEAAPARLTLRADADMPAAELAAALARLAALGIGPVELAVRPR
jgi:biopolymer transport protein ExbD